ncbi:hypothetical protein J2045_003357 [Peteryoungia aggregata LMG 23059]|uniref:Secreted protein n=1 Tax=Peteryoungia aggregata LMG 23059 TaxID=1368425 RepID=A0ABU0GAC3_9HYPH|nr:hypothetical protein [Peteryoungia aggregata]MDQ0422309.1 hypothetical protein [Peteryoungia aggregata LMG 23059]
MIRPAPITTMALIIFAIVRLAPAPTVADTGKPFGAPHPVKSAPVASAPAPVVDEWAAYIPKLAPVPPRRPKPAKPRTRRKPTPRPLPIGRVAEPVAFTFSISIR